MNVKYDECQSINQSIIQLINQSIKNFINVSEIFSLQAANWGHNKKVYKIEIKCN